MFEINVEPNFTANNYHVDNTTVHLSFFPSPLLHFIERQFRRHFLYAEGFMLKLLQKRNSTIGAKEIADLLAHLHTPIIYAYVLFIGIIVSILAIPYICCFGSCIKKNIDVIKYQCCFPVEVMFLVLFTICLLVGIVGAYQITIQIQDVLMIFPVMWRNAMQDLLTNTDIFKAQVRSLVNTIETSSNLITNKTVLIPENLVDLYKVKLKPNLDEASLRINGNAFLAEVIFSRSGFVFNNNTVEHLVEVSTNSLRQKVENIYRILEKLQENMTEHYINFYSTKKFELVRDYRIFIKPFQFPKWKIIYDDLQIIFEKLLPAANTSLFFMDDLPMKMKNYSRTELTRVDSATRNLQELSLVVERNITQAIKELFPPETQEVIINATYKIDNYLSLLSLSRNYHKMRFTNGSMWIMLIPTIYAFIGFILLITAFSAAIGDLKNIILNVTWSPSSSYTSYALTIFRISMTFSISFLWFLLILTTIFYCMYLPFSVFCEIVKDQKFFTNYVDEPKVWNNNTWLEYKLQNYLPKHRHSLKMRNVLNSCYHNRSLYASLNMQEDWNVSQHIDALNMTLNMDILQTMVAKAVREVVLPDGAVQQLIEKLGRTEKNLDLHFVSAITRNVQKIQHNNIEGKLAKTINDIAPNEVYHSTRMQLLELLNGVKLQTSSTLRELSKLENFKYYLKNLQNEMIDINKLLLNFGIIINETSNTIVPTFLNSTSLNINSMITEIKTAIRSSIEKDIGNCYVLPFIHDKMVWSVCGHGLPIIAGAWITLGLISTSIFCCIIFSCRICGYIRGSKNHYYLWRQHLENQRYSSQTAKLNGTLLFDRSGNFMGSSITAKTQTEDKAV